MKRQISTRSLPEELLIFPVNLRKSYRTFQPGWHFYCKEGSCSIQNSAAHYVLSLHPRKVAWVPMSGKPCNRATKLSFPVMPEVNSSDLQSRCLKSRPSMSAYMNGRSYPAVNETEKQCSWGAVLIGPIGW